MQRQLQQQQQQQQYMPVGMAASSGYSFASNYRSNSTWSGSAASHNNGDMLVITDMQPDFAEALEARLVNKVCALADYAMARNWVIVVLEYVGKGDTLPEIRQRLAGYTRTFTVVKQTDNGSPVVLEHCKAHQLSISHYVLCGVSINACVRKTGCGLAFSSGHPMVDFIIEARPDALSKANTFQSPSTFARNQHHEDQHHPHRHRHHPRRQPVGLRRLCSRRTRPVAPLRLLRPLLPLRPIQPERGR